MEPAIIVIVLLVLGLPLCVGIWLVVRTLNTGRKLDDLTLRFARLEHELSRWRKESAPSPAEPATQPLRDLSWEETQTAAAQPPPVETSTPPDLLKPEPVLSSSAVTPPPLPTSVASPAAPPPLPTFAQATTPPSPAPVPPPPRIPAIDWEQFMGVKMFAWIGGLALFLGVVFFVKYSFEHNWISPEVRVGLGFLTGIGLLIGGIRMSRKDYPTLSQTLCATGVLILYAVTYACRSIYHFQFFDTFPTFCLMVLITTTAFLLAVRLNALVVGILGMLGGFLTPILIRTDQDNPLGLFGYIAILDLGLILVAGRRRWFFLPALAAAGTALMQIGWANRFFVSEHYFAGNKILIALSVLIGFCALYLAAAGWAKKAGSLTWWLSGSLLGLAATAFCFTFWFLDFPTLAQRPWLIFGFVFLIDLAVTALSWLDEKAGHAQSLAGFAVFLLLGVWTSHSLNLEFLNTGLALYLLFAIFHSVLPILRQRRLGLATSPGVAQLFPPIALLLVLIPIFRLTELSFAVWPVVLLIDILAIGLAALTASLLPVLAVLLLTVAATGGLLFKIPASLDGLPLFLILLGAFSVFFVGIGLWLTRKFKPEALRGGLRFGNRLTQAGDLAVALPALSAILPFLLLIMAMQRLALRDPSPVFGLALLLVVMLLGITKLFSIDWMPAVALGCVVALETSWHFSWFDPARPEAALPWYLLFLAVFTLFPFLFARRFASRVVPWAVAAMAGPPQFWLVHRLVAASYPNQVMGLLPAAFAIPPIVGLVLSLKRPVPSPEARLSQLAWFGGVALFFVTLIFPIQFHRQWLTIGWALEGAALLWLFLRVPHDGLRLAGVGLLVTAFTRLTLNMAVLEYQPRSATPIFNWYLYTYGIVTASLFAGAWFLAPPKNRLLRVDARALLVSLGTLLAFWLLNIEIFDAFTPPHARIEVEFSGNFTRDMTFSIAWGVFALMLLILGIVRQQRAFRYAGLGLLSITLIKLFFHDLAQLDQLYRIGAFVAVAVIAMMASFAYQRFFSASLKKSQPKDEPLVP
jgi:uncharacterized membrane protein